MISLFERVTDSAKFFIKQVLKENQIAVDATCGNGNDTAFLSNLVGANGKVFSFDIQKQALEQAKILLEKESVYSNYSLICDNHNQIRNYLNDYIGNVSAVMFNLGFLPGSDKSVKTTPTNTIEALKQCIELLATPGIITICVYPHKEGVLEEEAILNMTKDLTGEFNSYTFKRVNRNNPPYLIIITRGL